MFPFEKDPNSSLLGGGGGINLFGDNMALNMMANMFLFGDMARPGMGTNQSVYDAFYQKRRAQEYMQMSTQAFMNSQLIRQFNANQNSSVGGFSGMLINMISDPAMRMMAPLIGGNPIAAQAQMFANMQGFTVAGLGRVGQVGVPEMTRMMDGLYSNFYRNGAIDYTRTKGLSIEDITGGALQALNRGNFRLPGGAEAGSIFDLFLGGSGTTGAQVISASRAVFGQGLSGSEAIKQALSLTEGKGYNLASDSDRQELEDLLRKVKATAKTAGISIEAMTQIIEEGKRLSKSHPALSHLSGHRVTEMALESITGAQAAAIGMSTRDLAMRGGVTGIANSMMGGQLGMETMPVIRDARALAAYFGMGGQNDPNYRLVMDYLRGGDMSEAGYNRFFDDLAQRTGKSRSTLMNIAQNAGYQKMAGMDADIVAASKGRGVEAMIDQLGRFTVGSENLRRLLAAAPESSVGTPEALIKYLADNGVDLDQQALAPWRSMLVENFDAVLSATNGSLQERRARVLEEQQAYNTSVRKFEEQYGHLYAGNVMQVLFQGVLKGNLSEGGITELMTALRRNGGGRAYDSALNQFETALIKYSSRTSTEGYARAGGRLTAEGISGFLGDLMGQLGLGSGAYESLKKEFMATIAKEGDSADTLRRFALTRIGENLADRLVDDGLAESTALLSTKFSELYAGLTPDQQKKIEEAGIYKNGRLDFRAIRAIDQKTYAGIFGAGGVAESLSEGISARLNTEFELRDQLAPMASAAQNAINMQKLEGFLQAISEALNKLPEIASALTSLVSTVTAAPSTTPTQ
jgi:hypothetical protein